MQVFLPDGFAKHLLEIGPKIISRPLALIPFRVKAEVIERLLTVMLSQQAEDDELDFLSGRWVAVHIEDLALEFEVSFDGKWHVRSLERAEVAFRANSKELLLITAVKEDPDTLFFQRKLCIEGDTELGLEVKNLILSVEFDSMPAAMRVSIDKLATVLQKLQELQMKSRPAFA